MAGPPTQHHASDPEIRIARYEDWMASQVVSLMASEGRSPYQTESFFRSYFEHPFQKDRAVRLAALAGDVVCGFQSYVYWPYSFCGNDMCSFQSGWSMVSPSHRGRGIFARLLGFPWQAEYPGGIDFLMGFPNSNSFGSFLRNQWLNPLNLSWYVRVLRPSSVLTGGSAATLRTVFDLEPEPMQHCQPPDTFSLSGDPAFSAWRTAYSPHRYHYFHFRKNGRTVRYQLKSNQRGRISELVIGDIARDSLDPETLSSSLRSLARAARTRTRFTILSIALNEGHADPGLRSAVRRSGFHSIRRNIRFIVKPITSRVEPQDPRYWLLLRSDIDTW